MDVSFLVSASLQPVHNRMFRRRKFLTWQDEGLDGTGLTLAVACVAGGLSIWARPTPATRGSC